MRMRLARLALAPMLALAPVLMQVGPVAAGSTGGGNTLACSNVDPTTIATYSSPTRVNISGSGGVTCGGVGDSGNPWSKGGSGGAVPAPQPPGKGTKCQLSFQDWIQFQLAGGQPESRIWEPASNTNNGPTADGQRVTVDISNWQPTAWSPVSNASSSYGVTVADYNDATNDEPYIPVTFTGTYDGNGWECEAIQQLGTSGFLTPACRANALCIQAVTPIPPTVGVTIGVPPNVNLAALVTGNFTGGDVTSLPAQPHPSVVNVPTCFYITRMTVRGGGDPLQPQDWQQIVEGPVAGPDNRHVYFTLVYHVHLVQTVIDFGDGNVVPIQPNGSPTDVPPLPPQCPDIANQQFLVAHTYDHYTPAGSPFQVKVTHEFGVDVTEAWHDSLGDHTANLGQVVQAPVGADPQPAFNVVVVQEEGIPVGG